MKRFLTLALAVLFAVSPVCSVSLFGQGAAEEEGTLPDCKQVAAASNLGTTQGLGFGAIASAVGEGRSSVWQLSPLERGREIEKSLGVDPGMAANFPVIDSWSDGTITSIKSLDLSAKSYQDARALTRTLKGYIDALAKFSRQLRNGKPVPPEPIKERLLEVAVPTCKATSAQQQALRTAIEYGKSVGVVVKIVAL